MRFQGAFKDLKQTVTAGWERNLSNIEAAPRLPLSRTKKPTQRRLPFGDDGPFQWQPWDAVAPHNTTEFVTPSATEQASSTGVSNC